MRRHREAKGSENGAEIGEKLQRGRNKKKKKAQNLSKMNPGSKFMWQKRQGKRKGKVQVEGKVLCCYVRISGICVPFLLGKGILENSITYIQNQ